MSLRGSVHAFPLETVLQLLADTGKTGRLEVRADERGGTLAMSNGRLVSAWSEDDSGPLALGAIFTIQRGQFEFQSLDRVEGSDLSGELDELLDRAVAERDRVAEIRSIVPDERMRFTLSERAAERAEIRLSADQWRALLAVDGERDVAALARRLGIRRLAALDLLAGLVRAGMIDANPPPPDATARQRRVEAQPINAMGEPVHLRGTTSEFPLETILQLLAHTRKTGRLEVRSDHERSMLGFDDGRLASATSEEESGDLALGATFAIASARFEFVPMDDAPEANLTGSLDELLDRAAETRDRIAVIRGLVPDERARFKLSDRATRQDEIRLTPEEWRALLAINGERDVAAIAERLRMRRLPTMVVLADLIEGGLVDVLAPAFEEPLPAFEEPSAQAVSEAQAAEIQAEAPTEEPLAETPLDREPAPDDRFSAITSVVGPAEPAPPPGVWPPPEPPEPTPEVPPVWDASTPAWEPPTAEPAAPTWEQPAEGGPPWEPPAEELPSEEAAAEPEAYADPRLAAFGAPPQAQRPEEPEAYAEPEPQPEPEPEPYVDPRLAAFGAPPAEPAAEAPTWTTPAAETISEPEPVAEEPVASDLVVDLGAPVEPAVEAPPSYVPPAEPEKKKSLFGGLFGGGRRSAAAAPAAAAAATPIAGARSRPGQLALFVNELLAGYNSGKYGKGRVDDRMVSLLMRVDEQADPIDRTIPVRNDRLDVAAIDGAGVPERQALPYLATLTRLVYEDAERAFGKDKAKRGFRDTRERLFGKDLALFQAPEVAGRVPKA